MRLSSLTTLGLEINAVWDSCPDQELNFAEIHTAADEATLVALLAKRFEGLIDLSLLMDKPIELREVESALRDAAVALKDREGRKVGVKNSGLCLFMAIIFEAIQQQFCPLEK